MSTQGPRVHPNLLEKHAKLILEGESLLSEHDRELVQKTVKDLEALGATFQPTLKADLKALRALEEALSERDAQKDTASQTSEAYDDILMDIHNPFLVRANKPQENIESILESIITKHNDGLINLGPEINKTSDLIRFFGLNKENPESEENREILKKKITELKAIVDKELARLENEAQKLNEDIYKITDKISDQRSKINAAFDEYQEKHGIRLDHDDGSLLKIYRARESKGKKGPEFSVVFSSKGPFILYTGKKRILGEGGFGIVKIAQDFSSGELVAVKRQDRRRLPEKAFIDERNNLEKVHQLKGHLIREREIEEYGDSNEVDFDYIFSKLHYGDEVQELLNNKTLNPEDIYALLGKAADELQKYHTDNLIHRDIKPENFKWDAEHQECHLLDLAFIEEVDADNPKTFRDGAGTDAFMSPEVLEPGEYSKSSDVYAFGVMMKDMFEQYPRYANEKTKELIISALDNDPAKRPSMEVIAQAMKKLQKHHEATKRAESRPSITTQQDSQTASGKKVTPSSKEERTPEKAARKKPSKIT